MDRVLQRQQRDLCRGDEDRELPAAVGGDGIEGECTGPPRWGRTSEDGGGKTGEARRPGPGGPARRPPGGGAGPRPADRIDDQQRAMQPMLGAVHAGGDREHGCEEEKGTVDDPVAPRTRRDRRVVVLRAKDLAKGSTDGGHTGSLGSTGRG